MNIKIDISILALDLLAERMGNVIYSDDKFIKDDIYASIPPISVINIMGFLYKSKKSLIKKFYNEVELKKIKHIEYKKCCDQLVLEDRGKKLLKRLHQLGRDYHQKDVNHNTSFNYLVNSETISFYTSDFFGVLDYYYPSWFDGTTDCVYKKVNEVFNRYEEYILSLPDYPQPTIKKNFVVSLLKFFAMEWR